MGDIPARGGPRPHGGGGFRWAVLAALAASLGVSGATVAGWEALGRAIAPSPRRRLLPLLARELATPEGAAFLRSLGWAGEGPDQGEG